MAEAGMKLRVSYDSAKPRVQRILECLAASPDGLTTRQITAALGDEDGRGMSRNSCVVHEMASRRVITRASGRVGPYVISETGLTELAMRQAGYERRKGRQPVERVRRRGTELADEPVVLRTVAVPGQAPRGIPSSPFTWGLMLSQGERP